MNYATLYQIRQYLELATDETGNDTLLARFAYLSSRFLESKKITGRKFYPSVETRRFDVPANDWLNVGRDLLSITTLTNGDSTVIDFSNFFVEPYNTYPKTAIVLNRGTGIWWRVTADGEWRKVIQVAGLWGYHDDYGNAWIDSDDAVADAAGINASVTSITVTDADGTASDLDSPRFQVGHLIRIESEYLDVQAVNTSTNVLTVKRGVNGSTAATHALSTQIDVFRPIDNIQMAAMRLAVWRYRQKDVNSFDRTTILGAGIAITPAAIPADVLSLLPVDGGIVLG